jgi:hypothetical protein
MSKMNLSSTVFPLGLAVSIALTGCHSAGARQAAPQVASSTAPVITNATLKEIHVDQKCHILQDEIDGVTGSSVSDRSKDLAVCHLESVLTSDREQETLKNGVSQREVVKISEQEYLLQNVTPDPVIFVVEHSVPDGWHVDSDPQPVKMIGSIALFRVSAEPGQIVRLHVGEQHPN